MLCPLFDVLQCDLSKKNEELEALREQHELLQKMLRQQQQLKALKNKQTALVAMQREAEQRLHNTQIEGDIAHHPVHC